MLVINYNGNKPTTDYFKYSVQGNNNADIIRFLVSLNQGGLVFGEGYRFYAKVQCEIDDYYDKVELSEVEFDDTRNLFKADFKLELQQTSHKQIEVSLCCENIDEEIVWQTQLVKVAISNGVNADEEVAKQYPTIIANLQKQIDELKQGGAGKYIMLSMNGSTYYNQSIFRGNLRLHLYNFSEADIGTYIHLYHCTPRTHRYKQYDDDHDYDYSLIRTKGFKHPANFDSTSTNICKLGFGVIANKRPNGQNYKFCPVPDFMPHNGFMQTEYIITAEHIAQGYMEIDIGRELLCLYKPIVDDDSLSDDMYCFIDRVMTIPSKCHYITFMQVIDGAIKCMPTNMIMLGNSNYSYFAGLYGEDENGQARLTNSQAIKLISF